MYIFLCFLLYYVIAGLLVSIGLRYVLCSSKYNVVVENIQELSDDLKISEEECIVIAYTVSLLLGFLILPIFIYKKVIKFIKKEK